MLPRCRLASRRRFFMMLLLLMTPDFAMRSARDACARAYDVCQRHTLTFAVVCCHAAELMSISLLSRHTPLAMLMQMLRHYAVDLRHSMMLCSKRQRADAPLKICCLRHAYADAPRLYAAILFSFSLLALFCCRHATLRCRLFFRLRHADTLPHAAIRRCRWLLTPAYFSCFIDFR